MEFPMIFGAKKYKIRDTIIFYFFLVFVFMHYV